MIFSHDKLSYGLQATLLTIPLYNETLQNVDLTPSFFQMPRSSHLDDLVLQSQK